MKHTKRNVLIILILVIFGTYKTYQNIVADAYESGQWNTRIDDFFYQGHYNMENYYGYEFVVYENYIFLADYNGLTILDANNPNDIGYVKYIEGIQKICLYGDLLFASTQSGDRLYNISNIENPVDLGYFPFITYVSDDVGYSIVNSEITMYDLGQFPSEDVIGFYKAPSDTISFDNLHVYGNYLFLSDQDGIRILNATNSSDIYDIWQYEPEISYDIQYNVYEDLLYISSLKGLYIYNITDLNNPSLLKHYQELSWFQDVHYTFKQFDIIDNVLFASGQYSYLSVFNVTDPLNITQIGTNNRYFIEDYQIYGDNIYSLGSYYTYFDDYYDEYTGLFINSLSQLIYDDYYPDDSDLLLRTIDSDYPSDIFFKGQNAYIAERNNSLKYVKLNDKQNPELLWEIPTNGNATSLDISGTTGILADGVEGIKIFDKSISTSDFIGSYNTEGFAKKVSIMGKYAYVADGNSGVVLLNLTDLHNPTEVSNYTDVIDAVDIAVQNGIAYIADKGNGLLVVDFSDKENPILIQNMTSLSSIESLTISEHKIYVACGSQGLKIINISEKTNPFISNTIPFTEGDVIGVDSDKSSISILIQDYGLIWGDIYRNDTMTIRGTYELQGIINGLRIDGTFIYTPCENDGVNIIKFRQGLGDDLDEDNLNFFEEKLNFGTNTLVNDTDGDGIPDGFEAERYLAADNRQNIILFLKVPFLDPKLDDGEKDVDSDGLSSFEEYNLGTDPVRIDTDSDGIPDGIEVLAKSDPLDAGDSAGGVDWSILIVIISILSIYTISYLITAGKLRRRDPLDVFISHAVIDYEKYSIQELSDILGDTKEVNKGFICEQDMRGNIEEWMDEVVPISDIFIFIATKKSVFNSPDCAREIRLAKENNLYLIPIRTPEVTWDDIDKIGLPKEGIDYPVKKKKELYKQLMEILINIKEKLDKIEILMKKNDILTFSMVEEQFEISNAEVNRLVRIILKEDKVDGIITRDHLTYLGSDEIKHRVNNLLKQMNYIDVDHILYVLKIDPEYRDELIRITNLEKKLEKQKKKGISKRTDEEVNEI